MNRLKLLKVRRQRLWAGLVAETKEGCLVGYSLISLQQPLALLPPPFPSSSPLYLYLDGLAIDKDKRKIGVGTALLNSSERIGEKLFVFSWAITAH